jgi:hypothetical protein
MPKPDRRSTPAHVLGQLVGGAGELHEAGGHAVGLGIGQLGLLLDVDHAAAEIHRRLSGQHERGGHRHPAQHVVLSARAQGLAAAGHGADIGVDGGQTLLPRKLGVHVGQRLGQFAFAGDRFLDIAGAFFDGLARGVELVLVFALLAAERLDRGAALTAEADDIAQRARHLVDADEIDQQGQLVGAHDAFSRVPHMRFQRSRARPCQAIRSARSSASISASDQ